MYNLKSTIYSTIFIVSLAIFNPLPALAQIGSEIAGEIPNAGRLDRELIRDAQEAIAQIEYAELGGRVGQRTRTIAEVRRARADLQHVNANGQANIQIQPDGNNSRTIAEVLIPPHFLGSSRPGTSTEVERAVRRALVQSLDSGRGNGGTDAPDRYRLTGDPSNEPRDEL